LAAAPCVCGPPWWQRLGSVARQARCASWRSPRSPGGWARCRSRRQPPDGRLLTPARKPCHRESLSGAHGCQVGPGRAAVRAADGAAAVLVAQDGRPHGGHAPHRGRQLEHQVPALPLACRQGARAACSARQMTASWIGKGDARQGCAGAPCSSWAALHKRAAVRQTREQAGCGPGSAGRAQAAARLTLPGVPPQRDSAGLSMRV